MRRKRLSLNPNKIDWLWVLGSGDLILIILPLIFTSIQFHNPHRPSDPIKRDYESLYKSILYLIAPVSKMVGLAWNLQQIHNAVRQWLLDIHWEANVIPLPHKLHQIPIGFQVQFVVTYKAFHSTGAHYREDYLSLSISANPKRDNRVAIFWDPSQNMGSIIWCDSGSVPSLSLYLLCRTSYIYIDPMKLILLAFCKASEMWFFPQCWARRLIN